MTPNHPEGMSGSREAFRLPAWFHRHLFLACLAVITSWVLPGPLVHLSGAGFLYLTGLLALRLGQVDALPSGRHRRQRHPATVAYRLLALATALGQLLWLLRPGSLQTIAVPLLVLVTLFAGWSTVRLVQAISRERSIDGHLLYSATAGYLLLGISGGLLLTALASVLPGGFRDNLSGELLTLPLLDASGSQAISWDLDYGRLNYFAFVSLTTVGYGDITPVLPLTRLACLTLSVVGPLYIAVVLGVLISRFSAAEPPQAADRPPAPGPPDPPPGG
ncbi:MAG: potassium channel family protein [Cyanobium sp.]